jgi:3-dehydroquinate synthase
MSPDSGLASAGSGHATTGSLMVELAERRYPVHIASGLLDRAGDILAPLLSRPVVLLVTDANVAATPHLARIDAALAAARIEVRRFVVAPGESSKNLDAYGRLVEAMLATGIDRKCTVLALGGGVIGDLAGFCAATALRGLPFVQVPTTLLAQVDSSVGGKTGINSAHGKNLIGAFHQPLAVLIDVDVLDDLPERELKAGYAEVIKHGCLADADYFGWLETHAAPMLAGDRALREQAIRRSVEIKAGIVAEDERETSGRRALLNFGHTFAHAYEALTGYGDRLLHGEAVALGMVKAARLSAAIGVAASSDAGRLEAHLESLDIATDPRRLLNHAFPIADVVDAMTRDKKAEAGALRFVLWRAIGDAFLARDVDPAALRDVLATDS